MQLDYIENKTVLLVGPGKSLQYFHSVSQSSAIDYVVTLNDVISLLTPNIYFVAEKYFFDYAVQNYHNHLKDTLVVFLGFDKKSHPYRIEKQFFENNKHKFQHACYIQGISSSGTLSYPMKYVKHMDAKSKSIVSWLYNHFPRKKNSYIRCGNLGNILQILLNYCPKAVYMLGFMDSHDMSRYAGLKENHKHILPKPKHPTNPMKAQISLALQMQVLQTINLYYKQKNVPLLTICNPNDNMATDIQCQHVADFLASYA